MNALATTRSVNDNAIPKILIVDDEDGLRSQLAFRFRMEGFDVVEARGGKEARMLVGAEKPQLVLTDIRMAGGTGKEFIEWAHREFADGESPAIICMSGFSDLAAKDAYGLRVSGFFSKPFDLDELVAACRHFYAEYKAKQRLRQSTKMDDDERRVLKESAAVIAHEIVNPLTVVQFALEHLQNLERTEGGVLRQPGVKKKLDRAMTCVRLMARNIQGIRMLHKKHVRADEKSAVDLSQMVREAVCLIQSVDQHAVNDLVTINIDPSLPALKTGADALEIILFNLLRNAFQARAAVSSSIPVTLVANVKTREDDAAVFSLSVSNVGHGIPTEVVEHLFEMGVSSKGAGGMGLGLAVSAQLAERLGGRLYLKQAASPTTFVLELPL